MYHVLHLPEILYNVFGHLAPTPDWEWVYEKAPYTRDLAVLARTCRAFKEPALDVLWSEILDLTTLAWCIPDAIYSPIPYQYAFKGPLTDVHWATLRSYGRRVWVLRNTSLRDRTWLEEESLEMLYKCAGDGLFPNLRSLFWPNGKPFPLHIAVESLRRFKLDLRRADVSEYRNILDSVGIRCPLMRNFSLYMPRQSVELDNIMSDHVLRWSDIDTLDCSEVGLRADAILHISRMSTLTTLALTLNKEIPSQIFTSDFVLVFPNLSWCEMSSGWLLPVAELLARTRLPALKDLGVRFPGTPSKRTLRSFMMALRNACSADTLIRLSVLSIRYLARRLCAYGDIEGDKCPVGYDDLYPCMAFGNLRVFKINLMQSISLTDDDVLELVSAWPHLQEFTINHDTGWRCPSPGPRGLTCTGLVRLLRACPLLRNLSLRLDTHTFVGVPKETDVSYPARTLEHINVVDSPLEPDMFAGVVDVFVKMSFTPVLLMAWVRADVELEVSETQQSWFSVDAEVKRRLKSRNECEVDKHLLTSR